MIKQAGLHSLSRRYSFGKTTGGSNCPLPDFKRLKIRRFRFHQVLWNNIFNLTKFSTIMFNITKFSSVMFNFTKFSSIMFNFTKFSSIMFNFTRFSSIMFNFTRFCRFDQSIWYWKQQLCFFLVWEISYCTVWADKVINRSDRSFRE